MNRNVGKLLLSLLLLFSGTLILLGIYRGPDPEVVRLSVSEGFQGAELVAKGTLVPEYEFELRAKTEGYLEGFSKREGDRTRKGEVLASIKNNLPDEFSLQLTQLESGIEKQIVQQRIAEENHRRFKRGFEQGVVAENQVLESQQQLQLADASLRAMRRELSSVRALRQARTATADRNEHLESLVDGVLTEKLFSNGEWVEKGVLVGRIMSVDRLQIRVLLLPEDATTLSIGTPVTVSLAGKGERWQEEVLQISPVIRKTAENSHLQEVLVSNRNAPLAPTVNTKVDLAIHSVAARSSRSLPLDAVFKQGNEYKVFELDWQNRPGFAEVLAQRGIGASLQYLGCTLAACDTAFVRLKPLRIRTGVSNMHRVELIEGVAEGAVLTKPNAVTQRQRLVVAPRS